MGFGTLGLLSGPIAEYEQSLLEKVKWGFDPATINIVSGGGAPQYNNPSQIWHWAKENLLAESEDLTDAEWTEENGAVADDVDTVTIDNQADSRMSQDLDAQAVASTMIKFIYQAKALSGTVSMKAEAYDPTTGATAGSTVAMTGSYQELSVEHVTGQSTGQVARLARVSGSGQIQVQEVRCFRYPNADETHLATTTAAAFGPRRAHYKESANGTWEPYALLEPIEAENTAHHLDEWVGAESAKDSADIYGTPSSIFTFSDSNAGASLFFVSPDETVVGDQDHAWKIILKQEDDETVFPIFRFRLKGGSAKNVDLMVNKNTGATTFVGTSATILSNKQYGDFFHISLTYEDTGTNDTRQQLIFPAGGTVWGSADVAAQGSVTVNSFEAYEDQDWVPDAPIPTYDAADTRAADTIYTESVTHDFSQGTGGCIIAGQIVIPANGAASDILGLSGDAAGGIWLSRTAGNRITGPNGLDSGVDADNDAKTFVMYVDGDETRIRVSGGSVVAGAGDSSILDGQTTFTWGTTDDAFTAQRSVKIFHGPVSLFNEIAERLPNFI